MRSGRRRRPEFERLNIAENKGVHAICGARTADHTGLPIRHERGRLHEPAPEALVRGSRCALHDPRRRLEAPQTVTDPLDEPIHAALKYHHNEIWRYRAAGSYIPVAPGSAMPTPGYVQIVSERVIPGMEDRYGELLDALNAALKKSGYRWPVLMFTSSYGDGAYKYLWQPIRRPRSSRRGTAPPS